MRLRVRMKTRVKIRGRPGMVESEVWKVRLRVGLGKFRRSQTRQYQHVESMGMHKKCLGKINNVDVHMRNNNTHKE